MRIPQMIMKDGQWFVQYNYARVNGGVASQSDAKDTKKSELPNCLCF